MASRIGWIDTARIIGMLAIIYGHFFPSKGQGFVYSFSVPIFFFLSGYLTKIDSCNFKEAFKKVFYSLFVPMFIFILYNWFFVLKHNHFELRINTTIEPVYRTILGCHQPILGTMWVVYDLIIIRLLSLI